MHRGLHPGSNGPVTKAGLGIAINHEPRQPGLDFARVLLSQVLPQPAVVDVQGVRKISTRTLAVRAGVCSPGISSLPMNVTVCEQAIAHHVLALGSAQRERVTYRYLPLSVQRPRIVRRVK